MTNATTITNETTTIEIGTLATTGFGSDCYPAVVTAVSASGKAITINDVEFILVHRVNGTDSLAYGDWYRASEGRLILGDISETGTTYTLRKNGRWIPKGQPMNATYAAPSIGDAIWRQDPSF